MRDIVAKHGVEAVARRNEPSGKPILEYHKFCIIWHGLGRQSSSTWTLQRLAGPSEASSTALHAAPATSVRRLS